MDTTQEQRKSLTLDEVTRGAVEKFRAELEFGAWALNRDEIDSLMREIADNAVPGDNRALLEIVMESGREGLALLYFDSETGATDARTILAEAIMDHICDRLESERRTFELEQDGDGDADGEEDAE